jgi:radical SAM superfamily enzyme YgiQ (UPF0313 family)
MPDANIHRIKFGPFCMSFREAPLTLTTLAALTPSDAGAEITLIDGSVQRVPDKARFDLVAISCLTGTALRAYEWARHFRRRGATVVLGGIHVTLRPDEAAQHADAIMTGFAETTWPQMITDFSAGQLKPRYDGKRGDVALLPHPRRDLQKRFGYAMPGTVSATRGCGGDCSFCSVPAADYGWQTRPIENVINEIRNLSARRFTFNDVNLLQDRNYALELLAALAPLKKMWGGLATVDTARDPEMLAALQNAGCQYLLCGFESLSEDALDSINKGFNRISEYKRSMEAFHAHGISIQGCFIFGLDDDRHDVFERTVETVNELKVDIPRYSINTPYPGTRLFRQLEQEGRLLHTHWTHYDTQHVVFQPKHMSPEELDAGFRKAYAKTFCAAAIRARTKSSPHPLITYIGNLAYKRYRRRLENDGDRIHRGGTP